MNGLEIPTLPAIGEVGPIPILMITPFEGQPRKYFDPVALKELADGIIAEGQKTPAWVLPKGDRYELIAGERRWRACQLAGKTTLICEVRKPTDRNQQYIDSVMENFGRKDCTVLEAARAVDGVIQIKFGETTGRGDYVNDTIAKVFAKGPAWVASMRALMRLDPKVLALLEPPQKIPTQVALSLTNLRPEIQIKLAEDIINKRMRRRPALAHIRNNANTDARVSMRGNAARKRRGSDDWRMLNNFFKSLGEQSEIILGMPKENIAAIFSHRDPKDLSIVRKILNKRITQLQEIDELLGNL